MDERSNRTLRQHAESKGVAKNIELQEAKLNKSNTAQHAEKPPPAWSCSNTAQHASGSNCSISLAGSEYQLNIQALNKEAKETEKLLPETVKNQQATLRMGLWYLPGKMLL